MLQAVAQHRESGEGIALFAEQPEMLERGLKVLDVGLRLTPELTLDLVLKDATSRPVIALGEGADGVPGLLGRALCVLAEVRRLRGHLALRGKELWIWGDRMIDGKTTGLGLWEASYNSTARAIDLVPKDIVVCDWHYGKQDSYPSVPLLLQKGFRVWPSGWQPLDATHAFSAFARRQNSKRVLGYLCTTWGKVKIQDAAEWPPIAEVLPQWK